ncbi:DoxX family protein [uncultured Croceitalea sp.]|uniref:DoxX family protein n=1 Tax=uncultured Croceitalea sp. TaxID=1798908 RepID=UPI003305CD76
MIFKMLDKLNSFKDYASVVLRLVFLYYLFTSISSGIYKPSYADKFAENLTGLGFPIPLFFSYLGIWSVVIGYLLLVIGYKARLAAIPLINYFGVAIFVFHVPEGHGVKESFSAIILFILSIFFFINGPGKPSVDESF